MGLIHLDAGVFIGLLDADDVHHHAARMTLTHAFRGGDQLAMAASAPAECLVGPARRGDAWYRDRAVAPVERLSIAVIDLDAEIATDAARLRAGHRSLRLPDAGARDRHGGAVRRRRLVTTDARWPSPPAVDVEFTSSRI